MKNYFIYAIPKLLMPWGKGKKIEAEQTRRLKKIKEGKLQEQKREIVNLTVSYLVRRLYEIDPKLAKRLEKKIRTGELKIRVLPGKSVAGEKTIKSKQGAVKVTTHGYITTYYGLDRFGRQRQIGQVITLPEAKIFKKHGQGVDLARKELGTLIHELVGHATEKEHYYPKKERELKAEIMGELRADIITVNMLERLQAGKKVIASYVAGRPLENVLIAQARAKKASISSTKKKAFGFRNPAEARPGMTKKLGKKLGLRKRAERKPEYWG